jgi:hypothetical protein
LEDAKRLEAERAADRDGNVDRDGDGDADPTR